MDLYTDRLLRAAIPVLVAVITYGLESYVGLDYAFFIALCVGLMIFVLLPVLYRIIFDKQVSKTSNGDDVIVVMLALIGIFVIGAAIWDKTH